MTRHQPTWGPWLIIVGVLAALAVLNWLVESFTDAVFFVSVAVLAVLVIASIVIVLTNRRSS